MITISLALIDAITGGESKLLYIGTIVLDSHIINAISEIVRKKKVMEDKGE